MLPVCPDKSWIFGRLNHFRIKVGESCPDKNRNFLFGDFGLVSIRGSCRGQLPAGTFALSLLIDLFQMKDLLSAHIARKETAGSKD
jgi:hypothetical protein